jgi:hypothetical protein
VRNCGQTPSAAQLLGSLLDAYARTRLKKRYGEKTPQHLRHVPRILTDFPNTRVLCLIRDGREVALSLWSMPWWADTLQAAAGAWLEAVRLSDAFALQYPACFRTVRYEHLVAFPEETLVSVMGFLGLDFQAGQLVPSASGVVLRRSAPWKGLALGPIDAARVGHRQQGASPRDLEYLNSVLGPTLRRLEYSCP